MIYPRKCPMCALKEHVFCCWGIACSLYVYYVHMVYIVVPIHSFPGSLCG